MLKHSLLPQLTQYCLLLAIPIMALPHVEGLPWWVFVISAFAFSWQLAICQWQWSIPPLWLRTVLMLGSIFLIIEHYRSIQNLDAYIALLLTMHAQKTLEIRSRRDVFLTVFIGLFCVGTRLLYVQTLYSMLFALLGLVFLFFTLHSFYAANNTSLLRAVRNILGLLLKASPMVLVLFLLFPRIPPLIVIPDFASSGVTGVSDSVAPGSLAHLAKSREPAFRVEFVGKAPPAKELYWRGIVLEHFNGNKWSRGNAVRPTKRDWLREEINNYPSYQYSMTVEASNQYWLFTLATAISATAETQPVTGFSLATTSPLLNAKVIELVSVQSPLREGLMPQRHTYLQDLSGRNPKAQAWGRALGQRMNQQPKAMVAAISELFTTDFAYSLEPPLLANNSIDDFLFNTKVGYCEHFASAAAVILRAAGVPTRLVVGYMGGEKNPYDNYILVRQLDAHAWVEYWLPDLGWQRFDPTAVVAPERISQGSEASLRRRNEYQRGLGFAEIGLFRNISLWADSLNHQWTRWFLEYDQQEQFGLLEDVTGVKATMERLLQTLIVVSLLVMLPFFLYAVLLRLRTKLPLALSLVLVEKGFAWAGLPRATDYRAVTNRLDDNRFATSYYSRLYQAWDSAWYQGITPALSVRCQAFIWASALMLWGFFRRFTTAKVSAASTKN